MRADASVKNIMKFQEKTKKNKKVTGMREGGSYLHLKTVKCISWKGRANATPP